MKKILLPLALLTFMISCKNNESGQPATADSSKITLITLDPGHFHAALVQKEMYPDVDSNVFVYAPAGQDLDLHLKRIESYNTRAENPTHWKENIYTGADFFQKMIDEKKGNVVVMSGNNQKKAEYILNTVSAGLNVLADKPMAIDKAGFELVKNAFAKAKENKVLLYDIMTERFEINTTLQREFSQIPGVFGTLEKGTPENPAVTKESVHYLYKFVSGSVLQRPAWFLDVTQQGEGIVDVTTHLVDLVQWECFPEQAIDYQNDIEMVSAKRWTTPITLSQFTEITKQPAFPDYLKKDIQKDSILNLYSNGSFNYKLRGVNAKVSVTWGYKAPEGTGDTHYSIMRGTKANLVIRQGAEQNYKPVLYIEPVKKGDAGFEKDLAAALKTIQEKYPGVELKKIAAGWQVAVPEKYNTGHEAHFGQVMQRYLQFLKEKKLPDWEVPNMIAKYFTTTSALELAKKTAGK
ncbi:putative oxidoreductase C-terminal domain-containing protein [Niabella beijingensis]|uniref:putative oxidoreductase C-terminal domain-containing protein n=1 Tax=Niabella beijingensis TaxID=2872700 RepID=UPI001CC13BFD|nr:putative oxidoreductase C-terminal domain-containing protein [Niabella beijingensis]MBZ4188416.1 oxidoreductase [Niabella beijingensis]